LLGYAFKGENGLRIIGARLKLVSESSVDRFRNRLDTAESYPEIWQTVKDTVEFSLGKRRGSMMLFLDDLPLQLGAYHPVGTNNIVLNRALVEIVEASMKDKRVVNALAYNLLLHEYLHALGELSESKVRGGVIEVAEACFGDEHAATLIARKTPWFLLQNIPLQAVNAPKRVIKIIKDFEKTGTYIV
jgi:hypothetical protein